MEIKQLPTDLTHLVRSTRPLYIVSGEGTMGTRELYHGKRTVQAIRGRLTRERCGGERWARIEDADGRMS